jgi:Lrp/AsnC family leucine-responsive transcriptional regulator
MMQRVSQASMRNRRPDATDERILSELVQDARASYTQIGQVVNLSANAVAQRVRRLGTTGLIRGYQAILDPALHDPTVLAVLHLQTTIDADACTVESALAAMPAVVEVLDLAGSVDYEIRLRCAGPDELYDVVQAIRAIPGITATQTRPVLRQILSR